MFGVFHLFSALWCSWCFQIASCKCVLYVMLHIFDIYVVIVCFRCFIISKRMSYLSFHVARVLCCSESQGPWGVVRRARGRQMWRAARWGQRSRARRGRVHVRGRVERPGGWDGVNAGAHGKQLSEKILSRRTSGRQHVHNLLPLQRTAMILERGKTKNKKIHPGHTILYAQ